MIVSARPDAYVHLGFARDVPADELAGWVAGQRTGEMLAATNRIPVAAGDAILCPADLPHAIGDGILLVEVQEPTDYSVLLEYEASGLPDGHLGLRYDLAPRCVDRAAWTPDRLAGLRGNRRLLSAAADEFFSARRLHGGDRLEQRFCVLVAVAGAGRLTGGSDDLVVRRGTRCSCRMPPGRSAWTAGSGRSAWRRLPPREPCARARCAAVGSRRGRQLCDSRGHMTPRRAAQRARPGPMTRPRPRMLRRISGCAGPRRCYGSRPWPGPGSPCSRWSAG